MTRLGWGILAAILLLAAGFASVTRFGTMRPEARVATAPAESGAPVVGPPLPPGALVVPVAGVTRAALRDSWGDARDGGSRGHHGIDIPAAAGTPVLAAAAGRVEKLFQSARGGTTMYVRSVDGTIVYYYAHLSGYAAGLHEGQRCARARQSPSSATAAMRGRAITTCISACSGWRRASAGGRARTSTRSRYLPPRRRHGKSAPSGRGPLAAAPTRSFQ
ncbi:M23 family metallopeptidase [Sphingomonas sp.]|uniref:M23 family metallopeptidase n=1 Tax=Sphingomonas sp. TaxID=28214 RepID=UPI00286FAEE2|nr:M23 family metallopeptidase [Sphingomonas sp.]